MSGIDYIHTYDHKHKHKKTHNLGHNHTTTHVTDITQALQAARERVEEDNRARLARAIQQRENKKQTQQERVDEKKRILLAFKDDRTDV